MLRSEFNQWLVDLRSGEFKQGPVFLHNITDNTWCCLGVFMNRRRKIDDIPTSIISNKSLSNKNIVCETFNGDYISIFSSYKNNFYSHYGKHVLDTPGSPYARLTYMNDAGFHGTDSKSSKTFIEIADILEANPEEYCIFQD